MLCYIYALLFICSIYFKNILILFLFLLLILLFLEICLVLLEKELEKEMEEDNHSLYTDYPCLELFEKREKQLGYFETLLEELYIEPYAIMINAKWGMGKTSFVKALEKKLQNAVFIWIEIGNEKNVKQIMNEISLKLLDVLKENNVYVEDDGVIKKYFLAFSSYIGDKNSKFFDFLIDEFASNVDVNSKEYIEKRLQKLNKPVYLVIDDLDRCRDVYQEKMFKILRECTNLNNCKTIFLADKNRLYLNDGEYLEKYINYTLDLCDIEFKDIVDYFFKKILNPNIGEQITSIFEGRYAINEGVIYNIVNEIKNNLNNEMILDDDNVKNLKIMLNEIDINTKNVRKVKRFLKLINLFIKSLIDSEISNPNLRYNKVNWIDCMIKVSFIKVFLPQIYSNLKKSGSIEEYIYNYNIFSIKLLLNEITANNYFGTIYKNTYSDLIFKNDVYYDQSKKTIYLNELRDGKGIVLNVIHYITYYENKDDLSKILDFCIENKYNDKNNNDIILDYILYIIFDLNIAIREKSKLLQQNIDWLNSTALDISQSSLQIVDSYKNNKVGNIIRDNLNFFNGIIDCIFNEKISLTDFINFAGDNKNAFDVFVEKLMEFDESDKKDLTIQRADFGTDLCYLREKFGKVYLDRPECSGVSTESKKNFMDILEFLNLWEEFEKNVIAKSE